jgi:hypothetical protein
MKGNLGRTWALWTCPACFWADENQHRLPSVEFDCPGGPKPECRSDNSPLSRNGSLTWWDPVDAFGRDPEVRGGFGEGSLGLKGGNRGYVGKHSLAPIRVTSPRGGDPWLRSRKATRKHSYQGLLDLMGLGPRCPIEPLG